MEREQCIEAGDYVKQMAAERTGTQRRHNLRASFQAEQLLHVKLAEWVDH